MTTKLIFLGGGNMAEAIFSGLVNNAEFTIEVIQRNHDKASRLRQLYPNIIVSSTLSYTPTSDDIVILAIKPQQAKEACLPLKDNLKDCTLLSVMAGIPSATISAWLANSRVIRTMPNTPSSIKQGVTAIYYPEIITQDTKTKIETIFAAIGLVYIAKDEAEINKILPVSSSAVAFIYYFMEGLINSAVNEFGFSQDEATQIVKQTVLGSVALLDNNPSITIAEQRQRVTSKKGTTEQGILTFEQLNFHNIIKEAMQNCYNRALEMAQEFN